MKSHGQASFGMLNYGFSLETGVCIVLFIFVLGHFHPELHHDILQYFLKYAG